ncbi:MAG: AMP-binding enzyme, partial [Ferrovibrionaceae bacterium]
GATVIVMERFDAAAALALIARHRVSHAQWVPTMFVRLLKLPEAQRKAHDLSSLVCAVHAAAPCPIEIKQRMIDWWGPIVWEYYAGTEANGATIISSAEWLTHKGSVGRAVLGEIHVMNDRDEEVAVGEQGVIYFGNGPGFEYLNDPEKTASSRNARGWSTLGDIGRVDAEGYLYLTDRVANMIISGGVNIYPQEIENILICHPGVADVAVIGVPDDEFGEAVKAVVQPAAGEGSARLADELVALCRDRLAHYKCPRSVDFVDSLPRHPNGKLFKRLLRERYWTGRQARI